MARQLSRTVRSSGHSQSPRIFVFSSSRPLTGRSWTTTLLILYDPSLFCSPSFSRLFILLLLLVSGNVYPNFPLPCLPDNDKIPMLRLLHPWGWANFHLVWLLQTVGLIHLLELPGPILRSMFFRGDVDVWVCPPCTDNPLHRSPAYIPLWHQLYFPPSEGVE